MPKAARLKPVDRLGALADKAALLLATAIPAGAFGACRDVHADV